MIGKSVEWVANRPSLMKWAKVYDGGVRVIKVLDPIQPGGKYLLYFANNQEPLAHEGTYKLRVDAVLSLHNVRILDNPNRHGIHEVELRVMRDWGLLDGQCKGDDRVMALTPFGQEVLAENKPLKPMGESWDYLYHPNMDGFFATPVELLIKNNFQGKPIEAALRNVSNNHILDVQELEQVIALLCAHMNAKEQG